MPSALSSSRFRPRRDVAILKTLGFSPGQVRRAVAWQATTFVLVALAIGIPIGAAAGRLAWGAFADHLGALSEPVTPPLVLLVIVPAAVLIANLIAAVPAAIAGHMRPAMVLRDRIGLGTKPLRQKALRDHHALDLVGAFVDLGGGRILSNVSVEPGGVRVS